MKDNKSFKVSFDFSYTELTAVEEYLEQAQQNGMKLKEIKDGKLIFEYTQHRSNYRYCAEIFKGDAFVKEFISDCEKEGWEYVGSLRNELYIFRTNDPYASEIMTDEQQKFRTIAKRELLNPGYYTLGLYTLWKLIEVVFLRTEYRSLIAANYFDCMMCLFCAFYITGFLVKLIDFLLWYVKSKRCVKNGEKIPFINLKEHEQNKRINRIFSLVGIVLYFAASVFIGLGYVEDVWFQWMIGGVFLVEFFLLLYSKDKTKEEESKNILKHIIAVVVTAAVLFGVWSTALYCERKYTENRVNRLDSVLSESRIEATVLAQHYYWVREVIETNETNESDSSIWYEVFVSDIQGVRGQYIKRLHKKFEKYDKRILKLENHRWDEAYAEINVDGKVMGGYAFKDDKVIYVEDCYESIEKSLDIIYEKLFSEKK